MTGLRSLMVRCMLRCALSHHFCGAHIILEFDKLVRMVERQLNLSERVPSFYVKTLVSLEQSLNNAIAKEKEAKKKMNATNARALNTMKQRVRKTTKEYEKEVKLFQEVRRRILTPAKDLCAHAFLQDPEAFEREYAVAAAPVAPPKKSKTPGAEEAGADEDFTTVGKGGKAMLYTSETIFQNLQLIQEARGKKVCIFYLYSKRQELIVV